MEAFLAREAALGRDDLVFPILYIDVPGLGDGVQRQNDPVLSLIAKRQYVDWRKLRHRDVRAPDTSEAVELFCMHIRNALRRDWISPDERNRQEEAAARQRAEAERQRAGAEATRRAEKEVRQRAVEEEGRRQKAEAERQRADKERLRNEARGKQPSPSRVSLTVVVSLIGLVAVVALGTWLFRAPPIAVASRPTPSATPPPAPVAPPPSAPAALPPSAPATTPTPMPAQIVPAITNDKPLSPAHELGLKRGDKFKECKDCPEMILLPRRLAVGRFAVTFNEWDACVADGGCRGYRPADQGWGRDLRPVINVNFFDIDSYMFWLGNRTGQPYRLLSEAEYQYATDNWIIGPLSETVVAAANCDDCGSQWDKRQTAPVGSFAPNNFGLYDVLGNVSEWTKDLSLCAYGTVNGGRPLDCLHLPEGYIVRGGSWRSPRERLSTYRAVVSSESRLDSVGFRVARTLLAP